MPFGMAPEEGRFVTFDAGSTWSDIHPPAAGERVWVELIDQDRVEGRVVGYDEHRFEIQATPTRVARPRWVDVTRVVFLDRPRG
jgi:hypothetical protein